VFDRYTELARRVMFFTRFEASEFGKMTMESEHLLLGLVRVDRPLLSRFVSKAASIDNIRKEIEGRVGLRPHVSTSIDLPMSEECQRILAYASEEADRLNAHKVNTEHLLLGILREEKCMAAELLHEKGMTLTAVREEFIPTNRPSAASPVAGIAVPIELLTTLEAHGFTSSLGHITKAIVSANAQDWTSAQSELRQFVQTLVAAIRETLNGDESVFEGLNQGVSLFELKTGMPSDEDWSFRWRLTLLLTELLLKRFQQRLDASS
jgi:ATP-dependent Clp protease ATP-binding subunit ClpA